MDYTRIYQQAIAAREGSYSPYSHFKVGACLEAADGTYYTGANIENASYGGAICAERTAFVKAVSAGERHFTRIAIVGGKWDGPLQFCPPCGICRQVMVEFCDPETFEVVLFDADGTPHPYLLKEVLPLSFTPKDLA